MAMDSASGARPLSSFCTICSSCSRAASKLSDFTSSCVSLIVAAPFSFRLSAVHQRRHMVLHAAGQALEVIATFEQRHNPVAAALGRNIHKLPREPGKILVHPFELRQRVAIMRIEPG